MRRVLGLLAAVLVLGSTGAFQPAQASPAQCSGTWFFQSTVGLTINEPPRLVSFNMTPVVGACVPLHGASASGNVSGQCHLLSGSGVMAGHHNFTMIGLGTIVIFSGEVVGVLQFVPDVTTGHSCVGPPGATRFLLAGSLTLV